MDVVKGVEELTSLFNTFGSVDGYLSCVVAILYFGTVYTLEKLGNGVLAKPWIRGILADYAYPVSLIKIYPHLKELSSLKPSRSAPYSGSDSPTPLEL